MSTSNIIISSNNSSCDISKSAFVYICIYMYVYYMYICKILHVF